LVTAPIPQVAALDPAKIEADIERALADADAAHITGKDITPFLLTRLVEISGGESLQANLALLRNNAAVAAQIAVALQKSI
jgi:pseudouridine-5'-phosphate glycosidase